jgi:murein DD-endopeptidase MepM/ murein hydrolase activator NlpD
LSYDLEKTLSYNFKEFTTVLEFLDPSEYVSIDLSHQSSLIKNTDISNPLNMDLCITKYLSKKNKKVAYGGYLEKRNLYERSDYFNSGSKRNIHLGIDLWCSARTNVSSPLNGIIHSFANNLNFGDYGPTIILKHEINNQVFYTLYGHLSIDSFTELKRGEKVKKGEIFAQLGNSDENGNYAPHLHFQIIKDIGGFLGDYPGVSDESNLSFYKNNCPNPNLILGL